MILLTITTFVASNAWAWDSHGHDVIGAEHAQAMPSDGHADGDRSHADEDDHGCHASAHFLAFTVMDKASFQRVASAHVRGLPARFASTTIIPLTDPPIA